MTDKTYRTIVGCYMVVVVLLVTWIIHLPPQVNEHKTCCCEISR